jgi:hypothetical protein
MIYLYIIIIYFYSGFDRIVLKKGAALNLGTILA